MIGSSDYVIHNEKEMAGKWAEVFGNENPIHIEQGIAYGKHCVHTLYA